MKPQTISLDYCRRGSAAIIFVAVLSLAPLAWTQDRTAEARTFADSVLAMFDHGNCAEMYNFFDAAMRKMTKEQWIAACQDVARQRGQLISRELSDNTKSMGIYRFVFAAKCTEGKAIEDLSVTDKEGNWKIAGFWVRPDLETEKEKH